MAVTTFSDSTFPEEGTRSIAVTFADSEGNAVVPNADTIKWTLTDNPPQGETTNIINGREDEAIASASTVYIVLSGNDLGLLTGESGALVERVLKVYYEYNSDRGNDLPDIGRFIFRVENLHQVG